MNTNMTTEEFRLHWCEALRSGEYTQSKHCLHNDAGYCCLGVACEVYHKLVKPLFIEESVFVNNRVAYNGEQLSWPDEVGALADMYEAGKLQEKVGTNSYLAELNDSGDFTFNDIADIIETRTFLPFDFQEDKDGWSQSEHDD